MLPFPEQHSANKEKCIDLMTASILFSKEISMKNRDRVYEVSNSLQSTAIQGDE